MKTACHVTELGSRGHIFMLNDEKWDDLLLLPMYDHGIFKAKPELTILFLPPFFVMFTKLRP